MAVTTAAASAAAAVNGTREGIEPVELAIDLPRNLGTRVNVHLTLLANAALVFLASSSVESGPTAVSMGSFVYAMPDRHSPVQPMSTPLYTAPASLDFTTRMAKVLVRRLNRPCYVSSSINLAGAVQGGTVDEEMEAFRKVVEVVAAAANP